MCIYIYINIVYINIKKALQHDPKRFVHYSHTILVRSSAYDRPFCFAPAVHKLFSKQRSLFWGGQYKRSEEYYHCIEH